MNTFESGSDPYCVISLVLPPREETIFKTEVVRKVTTGSWEVDKEVVVSDNASASLKFEVWVQKVRTTTNLLHRIGIVC